MLKSNIWKIYICLVVFAVVLIPSASHATVLTTDNAIQTIDPNAPIQVKVLTHNLHQYDSWVQPYIVTSKGNVGKWDIAGYTYYKVGAKTGAEYYHGSGIILPMYTEYWGHKHIIRYISGWDYKGNIWTRPNNSKEPYEVYEIHTTFDDQNGSQTTIHKI
ncbi:hypothetical protein [Methanobacterium spitsbergense]|uniref:Uncharacterized protein n=1 Tax=Methanobacterium spitsbergense TaxID=2874285 RepID=A0A8T5UQG1_9EURY|nr:hypothetical protein [Methanobacterium spitsbergense]MBZ2166018.1 hypothetical protein [Methanobacterium spitsbergense]